MALAFLDSSFSSAVAVGLAALTEGSTLLLLLLGMPLSFGLVQGWALTSPGSARLFKASHQGSATMYVVARP